MTTMMRVRLKADGRIVEILPDGSERAFSSQLDVAAPAAAFSGNMPAHVPEKWEPVFRKGHAPINESRAAASNASAAPPDAAYARGVRARTRLTQAQFAARIDVPIETVRNWEQGKRSPRGPARALLKVIDKAPDVAFAVLSSGKTGH